MNRAVCAFCRRHGVLKADEHVEIYPVCHEMHSNLVVQGLPRPQVLTVPVPVQISWQVDKEASAYISSWLRQGCREAHLNGRVRFGALGQVIAADSQVRCTVDRSTQRYGQSPIAEQRRTISGRQLTAHYCLKQKGFRNR